MQKVRILKSQKVVNILILHQYELNFQTKL